ncbi:hypothetical protein CPB83DRAFT_409310 [Crepidotus variabilis]|uniref:Uncharacterized protein n=1 Tax=Crepidotus variabilis TaxID=179855 RepID=A0A9P6JVD8_9AGAR|nr:hypothetical protein CPB83DRAFT_409310 [Crepidotus variabilis]
MEADQNHQKELEARVEALQEALTKEITRVEKMKMITDAWRQEVVSVQSKLDEALQQTAYQTAEIERLTVKYSKLEHSMSMNSNQWIIPTIQASSGHKASASPTITEELDFLAKCEAKLPQQLSDISSTVPAIGQSTFSSSTVPNPVNISQTGHSLPLTYEIVPD